MAQAIATASRQVNGDASSPILRTAIDKAREYNFPSDNIKRAIERGKNAK